MFVEGADKHDYQIDIGSLLVTECAQLGDDSANQGEPYGYFDDKDNGVQATFTLIGSLQGPQGTIISDFTTVLLTGVVRVTSVNGFVIEGLEDRISSQDILKAIHSVEVTGGQLSYGGEDMYGNPLTKDGAQKLTELYVQDSFTTKYEFRQATQGGGGVQDFDSVVNYERTRIRMYGFVPEPSTLLLLFSGAALLRKRRG